MIFARNRPAAGVAFYFIIGDAVAMSMSRSEKSRQARFPNR
jgi:hypothetical protein